MYGPKTSTPNAYKPSNLFVQLPHLNNLILGDLPMIQMDDKSCSRKGLMSRNRINDQSAAILFPTASEHKDARNSHRKRLLHHFGHQIGARRAVDVKEVLESMEFYGRVKTRLLAAGCTTIVDLAGGHGLAGILFAVLEPKVKRVFCIDRRVPPSHHVLVEAAEAVLTGSSHKIEFIEHDIGSLSDELRAVSGDRSSSAAAQLLVEDGIGIIGVHACGSLTDKVIEIASLLKAPVALMPCCYGGTDKGSPVGVRRALGSAMAADVDRSYRLEREGFFVDWTTIPSQITPMNRIIIALPRGQQAQNQGLTVGPTV